MLGLDSMVPPIEHSTKNKLSYIIKDSLTSVESGQKCMWMCVECVREREREGGKREKESMDKKHL